MVHCRGFSSVLLHHRRHFRTTAPRCCCGCAAVRNGCTQRRDNTLRTCASFRFGPYLPAGFVYLMPFLLTAPAGRLLRAPGLNHSCAICHAGSYWFCGYAAPAVGSLYPTLIAAYVPLRAIGLPLRAAAPHANILARLVPQLRGSRQTTCWVTLVFFCHCNVLCTHYAAMAYKDAVFPAIAALTFCAAGFCTTF